MPTLILKNMHEIAEQLKNIMNNLDDGAAFTAVGDMTEYENDRELLRASLEIALRLSSQIAKKYKPKKYRKEYCDE